MQYSVILVGEDPKYDFIRNCKPMNTSYGKDNESHSLVIGGKHINMLVVNKWTEFSIDQLRTSKHVCLFGTDLDLWKNENGEFPSNIIPNPNTEHIMKLLRVTSDNPKDEYCKHYNL